MKYTPCADSGFRKTTTYCAFDRDCFAIMKYDKAGIRRVYDTRDGSTCSLVAASCPC